MSYKKINLDKKIIVKNNVPLLVRNENWIKLFGNASNKNIQKIKDELNELVEKQKELEKDERTLQKEKNLAIKMILGISDSVNNENKTHNLYLLDEYKEKVENINKELDSIAYQLETLGPEVKELNFNLLKATVYYGYKELKQKEDKLETIVDELEAIRKKSKMLINEKYDHEEWIDSTYSFLHGMLGRQETEKLDEKIFK